ncbi:MAG TPA: hypothetical protein PKI56_09225, partial [Mesotoga prima]|nr:hypothetical protein [Mesotoga prima]HNS76470.1 hypothetical protein [Mesotoga prima]
HDAENGVSITGYGSCEQNWLTIQGFAATEEAIPTSAFGSPLLCHPELVSGSVPRTKNPDMYRRRTRILGGDGRPLTGNVLFMSVQRFLG